MTNIATGAVGAMHGKLVHGRRITILARHAAELLPKCESVLDVGCGDGALDAALLAQRPELKISGVDVLRRPKTFIPVELFDGKVLPVPDKRYDAVMLIDVLHHTNDPEILLREACRVAKRGVLIKDHDAQSGWDRTVLRFMDWVGNASHGVALPYNYLSMQRWEEIWKSRGLQIRERRSRLKLYPIWARPLFETHMHFMVWLETTPS